MNWLREAVCDSQTQKVSSKRVAMVAAAFSLAIAVVLLATASLFGYEVSASLGAVSIPLAGLGGYSYVHGKVAEGRRDGTGV